LIALECFKRDILAIPLAWKLLAERYDNAKPSKRAVKKLFENPKLTLSQIEDLFHYLHGAPLARLMISNPHQDEIIHHLLQADIAQEVYFSLLIELEQYDKPGHIKRVVGLCKKDFMVSLKAATVAKDNLIELRNQFLCANLRLVVSFALQYQHLGVDLNDLIQEGNTALVRAIEKFDPRRNLKFSTYATWWIKQSFIKLFRNQGRAVRLPAHIHELSAKVLKFVKEYDTSFHRNPSVSEISRALDVPEDMIENLNDLYADHVSLEAEISTGSRNSQVKSLKDFLVAETPDPIEEIQTLELSKEINSSIESLSPEEQQVIRLRYGLAGCFYTLDKISYYTKSSREKIKKIEKTALLSLREKMKGFKDECS
jgi:RNA polymerase sigma factor (sigma-70 family)